MKVIRQGELPVISTWHGECDYCGTVVEVVKGDIKHAGRDQDGDPGWYVVCPLDGCGQQITLNPGAVKVR